MFSQSGIRKAFENRFFAALAISVLALSIIFGMSRAFPDFNPFLRIFTLMDLGVRDALIQSFSQKKFHKDVVIVAIDDRTLSDRTPGLGRWQDFRRSYYADVIRQLKSDGAEVIGVDVLFSERSRDDDDRTLSSAIREAGNVVLGFALGSGIRSLPELSSAAASEGFFDPIIHGMNLKAYSVHPAARFEGTVVESFSFAVLREYLDRASGTHTEPDGGQFSTDTEENRNGRLYLFQKPFRNGEYWRVPYASPEEKGKGMLINYLPTEVRFPQISFADVYAAAKSGKYGDYRGDMVRGKIVLIGSTATALHDEFMTPVGTIPGIVLHANAINTVLNGAYLIEASEFSENAIVILLAPVFALFIMHFGSKMSQAFFSVAAVLIALAINVLVFVLFNIHLNGPVELSMLVFAIAMFATAYKHFIEEREKRLFHMALKDYVAEDIVNLVLQDYGHEKLRGRRREVTLFFSDIAGFTTISENMTPEDLVRFLSVYLKEASDIIMEERGFINKYEGDAIMAIWGAFQDEEDPLQAHRACESALRQQEKIRELNVRFKTEFGFEISVRMGINKGPAVVGNIGSVGKKVEFTALGDTVNTASRFEGINKLYGTLICVGEGVREKTKDAYVFRRLDSITVKGKDRPTPIFELLGRSGEVPGEKLAVALEYEKALNLYVDGNIAPAREIFERLAREFSDPPSETFVERCRKLEREGLPKNWTGVYRATEK